LSSYYRLPYPIRRWLILISPSSSYRKETLKKMNLKLTIGATASSFLLLPLTAAFTFEQPISAHVVTGRSQSRAAFVGRQTTQLASSTTGGSNAGFYTDDEWHPHDPAETTPQLLSSIWAQISNGITMVKGVSIDDEL
jgi:hypothetical protein